MTSGNTDRRLLTTSIIGAVIAAPCCFTPILVLVLGAVDLSTVLGWIDFELFPALAFFIALTTHAVWRRRRARPH